jgi:hypothetical protein
MKGFVGLLVFLVFLVGCKTASAPHVTATTTKTVEYGDGPANAAEADKADEIVLGATTRNLQRIRALETEIGDNRTRIGEIELRLRAIERELARLREGVK